MNDGVMHFCIGVWLTVAVVWFFHKKWFEAVFLFIITLVCLFCFTTPASWGLG